MQISDDYLIGFVEGEGMFYIGIVPSKETKTGWQVIYFFKVSQNPSGKSVLDYFCKRFGCGYLKENSKKDTTDKSLAYVVRDFKSIKELIIPFFKNKLIIKKDAFEKFCKVIDIVDSKNHLTAGGMKEILELAYSMNTGKRRVSKEAILEAYSNQNPHRPYARTAKNEYLGGKIWSDPYGDIGSLQENKLANRHVYT